MAIKVFERYGPRANPVDSNYTNGSFKNESVPGANDGTPLEVATINDLQGFTDALFSAVSIVADGNPDTAIASQRLTAHKKLILNESVGLTDIVFATVADMQTGKVGITYAENMQISTGVGTWKVTSTVTNTPLSGGLYAIPITRVGLTDYGAGGAGSEVGIQDAVDSGYPLYATKGVYNVGVVISLTRNLDLHGEDGAEIISTIPTAPETYNQIFTANAAVSDITVKGLKFSTANKSFNAFGFYAQVTNLELEDNECEGCGLVTSFAGAWGANINNNYIHSPASEGSGILEPYARPIHLNCLYTGTGSENIRITDNTILGSWTHGIEVSGNSVQDQLNPLQSKNINSVVVSGNIVKSLTQTNTAGAIWFSQVADVTVNDNICELYGDVGIDFEACRNAIADGNVLVNNNKNLAIYGNNNGVTFSNNICYNTISNLDTFYSKPANENSGTSAGEPGQYWVDNRNTNIKITGNTFHYNGVMTGFEKIVLGSGNSVELSNNRIINTVTDASYMSLTDVNILDNDITINGTGTAIHIGQSYADGDANAATFNAKVKRNKIIASGGDIGILYTDGDTVGASVDFDKRLDIVDNEIQCATAQWGVLINIAATITPRKNLYSTVLNNQVWGNIGYLRGGNRTVTKNVNSNTGFTGLPYSDTRNTNGTLNTWGVSFLDSTIAISTSLADGDYNGQEKKIMMSVYGGNDARVIIATHRLGANQNATFSAKGHFALLQWNVDAWDTISTTAAGI
jgi:hypothetical protein